MTGAHDHVLRWRGFDVARWGLCALLVLAAHVGSAAYIMTRDHAISSAEPPAAIVIDLSPIVAAPASQPTELPPSPQMEKTEDLPEKLVEKPDEEEATTEALKPPEPEPEAPPAPLAPKPDVAVAPPREPEPPVETKPVEKKPPETPKRPEPKKKEVKKPPTPTGAPQRAPQTARAETAPVAAASLAPSNALPAWKSMVSALLERNKRVPSSVSRGARGTAGVSFSVGRSGQLISVSLTRSAGDSELDQEAVALVRRIGSFPPPPAAEMRGASLSVTVPVRFDVR